ncbi:MAG: A/G-specific adenine glycosylase [Planctomycetes bacterium]|nr:A/G-specific adenine glycosylase [Planctomycetota bacterium]
MSRTELAATKRSDLQRSLLAWYAGAKRDLPWRRTRDPYAIWISEAMAQQTRVEVVVDYWARFLERFPTVSALAAAREDEVLALWSGLGYYRRARDLHAAARLIVERFAGQFPSAPEHVRELPGVGPYTAGAVLSIAFDAPEALVDGNVVRVLSRWFAKDAAPSAAQAWAWEVARELVPAPRGAGEWNQALMELGATVCSPRVPDCAACPVAHACAARELGLQAVLPRPKPRKAPVEVELVAFVVERNSKVLLEQRPAGGRMAGLWQFPTVQKSPRGARAAKLFPLELECEIRGGDELGVTAHGITHHRIRLVVQRGTMRARSLPAHWRWVELDALHTWALTGMAAKVLAQAFGRKHRRTRE